MPVTTSQFNPSQLWPRSTLSWMAPGAVKSVKAQYGDGLDLGALRIEGEFWEILVSRTPTAQDESGAGWIPFEPSNAQHFIWASAFNRYGQGWSYGPGHNMHNEVNGYFLEVYGRLPTLMEKLDHEHDRGLWQALEKAYRDKIGFTPGTPPPTPPPVPVSPPGPVTPPPVPITPPVPTAPLPPLSDPLQRAAELISLLPSFLQRPWMVPLAVEAVKAARRAQDRVVARIVAELRGKEGP